MIRIHFYGGPLDGGEQDMTPGAKSLVLPQFNLTYVFSEAWSWHFKRPTYICSNHKGPPPRKGVTA